MQKVDELNRKANIKIARNKVPLTVPVDNTENMQLFVLKQHVQEENNKKQSLRTTLSDLKTQDCSTQPFMLTQNQQDHVQSRGCPKLISMYRKD